MVDHGTLVKIMANQDTWNACQDHGKSRYMKRLPRSWQDLDKITMGCHGSYQEYHVKDSIEPFSVIASVLVGIHRFFSWKACSHVWEDGIRSNA